MRAKEGREETKIVICTTSDIYIQVLKYSK